MVDAGSPDAAAPAREAREVVSGAGRLSGGSMTMDVQVGHPVSQQKSTGGTLSIEGGAAVKP
jgi:hypothetical protein